ncbi:IncP plasmid survival protein KfrC family protein [Metapseudomonas furukawaii]|uniref:Long-chain-fatty-acid-CoA ligase n=1 Tax=Metapseudomonas furukawaii TaxID=1149133 RepID=A0AAD1C6R8_METFU|nr:IncP plasmid survival protein KfrC family protein [Pseudomonas furukawaii]BAU77422.1 long-chain-fatty-acid-CoA ligase [Pseudomonas furukawaii]
MERPTLDRYSELTAERLQDEQATLLDSTTTAREYSRELEAMLEGKHEQVERIEEGLSDLIERAEQALQRQLSARPGLLSLPGTRANWQQGVGQLEQRISTLHGRLDRVREIGSATNVHGSVLRDMAYRKLQAENPDLVRQWEELRERERKAQTEERAKKRDQERAELTENGRAAGVREGKAKDQTLSRVLVQGFSDK